MQKIQSLKVMMVSDKRTFAFRHYVFYSNAFAMNFYDGRKKKPSLVGFLSCCGIKNVDVSFKAI